MANTYKNIIITPNINAVDGTDPTIAFRGANTSVNSEVVLKVYPDSNGTLSFEGSVGQLQSITNDLTGTIFSVNDISGIPSIEVQANGIINLARIGGANVNVHIGNVAVNDGQSVLQVRGAANVDYLRLQSYGNVVASNGAWLGLTPRIPVSANSGATISANGINFVNTSTVTVSITSGTNGNANISFTSAGGGGGGDGSTANTINATNDTTTTTLYPVMVAGAASDQEAKVRTTSVAFSFNAASGLLSANNIDAAITTYSNTFSVKQAAPTISSETLTLDLNTGTVFKVNLNSNITTLTINNVNSANDTSSLVLILEADGTARTITWPTSFKWTNNVAPSITSTAGKNDIIVAFTYDSGTSWYSVVSGQAF